MSDREIKILYSDNLKDYELLDTGDGEKLERFGAYTFVRPYEDAMWPKTLEKRAWDSANGKFWSSKTGAKPGWKIQKDFEKRWIMSYGDIRFMASPTPFRHMSFFPEQASQWDFIKEKIKSADRPVKFLNLFGYTGVASLVALSCGAEVTHVDASSQSLDLAKENQKLSGLENAPMRVIEDDVIRFLEREVKRGKKYDCVIMDPPKFGRGPKGEIWKLEESLPKLLNLVDKVLSPKPLFVILTSYAIDASALSLKYALEVSIKDAEGKVSAFELAVLEKTKKRLISLANTAILNN